MGAAGICCAAGALLELARSSVTGCSPPSARNGSRRREFSTPKSCGWKSSTSPRRGPKEVSSLQEQGTDSELRMTIRRAIQEDYASGNLVRVDGWFLAATEALILALTAVAHS
jgi:hypothetical protein